MTLVPMFIHKAVAANISPIEVVGQFIVGNGVGIWVPLLEFLSLVKSGLEGSSFSKLDGANGLAVSLREGHWLVTVSSIVAVVLLIFAHVSLPSQVHFIDCLDQQVGLVRWHVLQMGIVPRVSLSPGKQDILLIWGWSLAIHLLGLELVLDKSHLLGADLMAFGLKFGCNGRSVFLCELLTGICGFSSLFDNPVDLDSVLFLFNTLLDVQVLDLLGVEALPVVLLHAAVAVHVLHEADHGLVALGIEVDVVAGSNSLETRCSIVERVVTDSVLNIVAEVAYESLSVVQLDPERLIVNGTPGSVDGLAVALVFGGAFGGLRLVAVEQLRPVDLFIVELEFVGGVEDLNLIWHLVRAQLIGLEQVYGTDVGVDVEVPGAEDVVLQAVNWLIGAYRIKWV